MDLRFRTWNVKSLYRTSSIITVLKELSKYVICSGVQEVRWEGGGNKLQGEYTFFY
jgi:hypothetical protein